MIQNFLNEPGAGGLLLIALITIAALLMIAPTTINDWRKEQKAAKTSPVAG